VIRWEIRPLNITWRTLNLMYIQTNTSQKKN
jgi:hypothetical protein